jgi:hypothetical protein
MPQASPASERPTLPPPIRERHSGIRVGRAEDPTSELLECFRRGDFLAVLSIADRVVADKRPVVRLVPDEQLRSLSLDHREGFILSLVDGRSNLETLLDASAMPVLDGLRIVCELFDARVIGLAKA